MVGSSSRFLNPPFPLRRQQVDALVVVDALLLQSLVLAFKLNYVLQMLRNLMLFFLQFLSKFKQVFLHLLVFLNAILQL